MQGRAPHIQTYTSSQHCALTEQQDFKRKTELNTVASKEGYLMAVQARIAHPNHTASPNTGQGKDEIDDEGGT